MRQRDGYTYDPKGFSYDEGANMLKDKRGVSLEIGQKVRCKEWDGAPYYGVVWAFEVFPDETPTVIVEGTRGSISDWKPEHVEVLAPLPTPQVVQEVTGETVRPRSKVTGVDAWHTLQAFMSRNGAFLELSLKEVHNETSFLSEDGTLRVLDALERRAFVQQFRPQPGMYELTVAGRHALKRMRAEDFIKGWDDAP